MKICALSENTAISDDYTSEHGLSIHVDMGDMRLLFDMGASSNFVLNARKMGIDLSKVDFAVISHGHDDHGGGLRTFLEVNKTAPVYVHKYAFGEYYSQKSATLIKRIGLDTALRGEDRIILVDGDSEIAPHVYTMCNIRHTYRLPLSNGNLLVKRGDDYVHDDFSHEMDVVIEHNGEYILFVGCAHNGIKNILTHFESIYGRMPSYVFGGFHLYSRTSTHESDEEVDALGEYLKGTGAHFYTCHCTGLDAYRRLKCIMGENIDYFSTGCAVEIK